MSRISCVIPDAYASTFPFVLGTIAMLLVIDPSNAFKVETSGLIGAVGPQRQIAQRALWNDRRVEDIRLRRRRRSTKTVHARPPADSGFRLKGGPSLRVSITRQGATAYSDSPPGPGGAK